MEVVRSKKTALVFGASGLVGSHLMEKLLADDAYTAVLAPTRRPLRLRHKKLTNHVWDFDNLEHHEDLLAADDVFISLGTTIKKAGSPEAFRRVDYNYIVTAARIARDQGCSQCMLVSSVGADEDSRFLYTRTKGETERDVIALGFWATHIFRPGVLLGDRNEFRLGERIGAGFSSLLRGISPDILGDYNPVEAEVLARRMLVAARGIESGVTLHGARELVTSPVEI